MRRIKYLIFFLLFITGCHNDTDIGFGKLTNSLINIKDWNKCTLNAVSDKKITNYISDGKMRFPKPLYYTRIKEIIVHVRNKEMQIIKELFNSDVDAIQEKCQLAYYCSASTVHFTIYKDGYAYDFKCYDGFDENNPYNTNFYYSYIGRKKFKINIDNYKDGIIFTSAIHEEMSITTFFNKGKSVFSAIRFYINAKSRL